MVDSAEPLPELDALSTKEAPTSPKSPVGLVYGGTPSSYQDAINQRKRFEAEQRRDVSDNLFQTTHARPDEAHMYSQSMQGNAYVILEVRDGDGKVVEYLECDVTTQPNGADGLTLALCIPCPVCVMRDNRLVADSIMLLQQTNRAFVLDPKGAGELWVNPNDPGASRMKAGTVTSEPFTCQNGCHTKWVIDKNWLRRA
jgi:hypothetical protein